MAVVNLKSVILKDNWPGSPNFNLGIPTGGFDGTTHHDVSTEQYPIGTKIQGYEDGSTIKGPYTMIYLHYYELSNGSTVDDVSDGFAIFQQFCDSNCLSADGTASIFTCTNCGGIDTGYKCGSTAGIIAIACGSLDSYDTTGLGGTSPGGYGWFWCGGVCPYTDITALSCDLTTGGSVAAGDRIYMQNDSSYLVFDGADLSVNNCGWAIKTDA